jgi:hypothetical protein
MLTVLYNPYCSMLLQCFFRELHSMRHGSLVKHSPPDWEILPYGWNTGRSKLIAHIDNAPTHNSRMTQNFFGRNSRSCSNIHLIPLIFFHRTSICLGIYRTYWSHKRTLMRLIFLKRSLGVWRVFQRLNCNMSFEVGSNVLKDDWRRMGLFERINIFIFRVSLSIASFMTRLIIDRNPYTFPRPPY